MINKFTFACAALCLAHMTAAQAAEESGMAFDDTGAFAEDFADVASLYGDTQLPADEASEARGGFSPVSTVQLEAVSSGNHIVSTGTGANSIGSDAFSNTSGIINIVQNSGNGVVIQNSMVVNLTMQP